MRRGWLLGLAATCAVLASLAIVTIDQPLARWLATRDTWPWVWDRAIAVLEYVGGIEPWRWGGIAVLVGGVAVTLAVPRWRHHARAWMFVATTHLVARNATLWIKTLTGRLRPREWLAQPGTTFFRLDGISFPSGHVMLFASVALPLAVLVPRARTGLFAVIGFVVCARVATDAHFASDVLAGVALSAAITWLCALACDPPTPRAFLR